MTASKNAIARWASALTLGQSTPMSDGFNTTKFFAKAPLRIHYAATFNNATASQIHHLTAFNWICCVQPEDLAGITTGAALVTLVEGHLTDQLALSAPSSFRSGATVEANEGPQSAGVAADEPAPAQESEESLPLMDGGDQ